MTTIKIKALGVVLFAMLLTVSGCVEKVADEKASSQRFFLEKIMVDSGNIATDVSLNQKHVVAHNGFGWIDISGIGKADNEKLTPYEKSLMRLIKPKGHLEGFAQADYGCADKESAIVVKYFLMDFPVDYLQNSEVSASSSGNVEEIMLNTDLQEEEHTVITATGNKRVVMEPVKLEDNLKEEKVAYRVTARGLVVDILADKNRAKDAEKCADLIAARIEREVADRYAILGEIIESRGKRPPSEVGLKGFMGHLDQHLDMGRQEYQPFRKKF